MNDYLTKTLNNLKTNNYEKLSLYLGNESCDLDSAVSAIVYATYAQWQYETLKCKLCTKSMRDEAEYKDDIFVPVLNVDREAYDIKTEVVFCLKECGIEKDMLVFRDDYDFEALMVSKSPSVTLVDHHVLAQSDRFFGPYVTEILDHRPLDHTNWPYKDDVRTTIEDVGSCCTLVCERIRNLSSLMGNEKDFFTAYPIAANLLFSTIVLDTVNFSKEVNKARPKDGEMVDFLEGLMGPDNLQENRKHTLSVLERARKDVSDLTAVQLLKKDVKIVSNVLVPSFPILIEELSRKPNLETAIQKFLLSNKCDVALLLGMKLSSEDVERDVAIYASEKENGLADKLKNLLEGWKDPNFQLSPLTLDNMNKLIYFKQLNKAATRKQYMPVVKNLLDSEKKE